jgi:hypothetical protein
MKRLKRIVLTGTFVGLAASVGFCGYETGTPTEASGSSTNGPTFASVTNRPIILKGLYGSRAGSKYTRTGDPAASAIANGLRWLRDSQNKDGSWGTETNALAAETGLALLAFLARGETVSSAEFGVTVEKGLVFLLRENEETNSPALNGHPPAICHAISTWAACEAYAMTRIPRLKPVAASGLDFILKGQHESGLWDGSYRIDEGGDDVEASVWQVLALKGGLMGGVIEEKGLRESLRRSAEAMRRVLEAQPDAGTAAGAVLCLQLCGEGRSPVCRAALRSLETLTPDWQAPSFKDPMFRWHLATQAFFHEGVEHWVRWNRLFNPMLVKHQVVQKDADGKVTGYWDSPGSGERFGRVYSTALSLLMLEVYQQRYLPTYEPAAMQEKKDAPAQDVEVHIQ